MARMRAVKQQLKDLLSAPDWRDHLPELRSMGQPAVGPLFSFLLLEPLMRHKAALALGQVVAGLEEGSAEDMHNIMSRSYLLMTDSGGLQEEGPHFGIPVVVLRTETERPEAVEAGTVVVAGTKEDDIFRIANELLNDRSKYEKMAHAVNPYGDGKASERIVDAIVGWGNELGEKYVGEIHI